MMDRACGLIWGNVHGDTIEWPSFLGYFYQMASFQACTEKKNTTKMKCAYNRPVYIQCDWIGKTVMLFPGVNISFSGCKLCHMGRSRLQLSTAVDSPFLTKIFCLLAMH